jgi:hypothetical protein
MHVMRDDDGSEWRRLLRERARRDAEELVPRPGYPIYGLASPVLRPVIVSESQRFNDEWTSIKLSYGDTRAGPYVNVTTAAVNPAMTSVARGNPEQKVEEDLQYAIERHERARGGRHPSDDEAAPGGTARRRLPTGDALVVWDGARWAARLLAGGVAAGDVVVTIVGQGVAPEDVRLETLPDLRAIIEAGAEERVRRIERNQRNPRPRPPLPELAPAEGVAALRALADSSLASHAEVRDAAQAGRPPRHDPDWGPMHNALWQRAAREHQRLRGSDARAANDAMTLVINHLGHLLEEAPWFTADARLREAAIDETLRHALLGDAVPSEPAQLAWSRYWSGYMAGIELPLGQSRIWAEHESRLARDADWRSAWEAWAQQGNLRLNSGGHRGGRRR